MACKYFPKALFLFAFIVMGSTTLDAQDNDSLLQQRIRQKEYVFVPQSCTSSSGTVPISSRDYKLEVFNDSVKANLPYFGRSNTPQIGGINTDDLTIVFSTTDFAYSAVAKKKGKWEIEIQPKDAKGIRVYLTVFSNGDAQLDITSPRKESMQFKGYVW